MNKSSITSARVSVVIFALVLAGATLVVVGKPIHNDKLREKQPKREPQDTLIALPSGAEEQYTGAYGNPALGPRPQSVAYSIVHEVQYRPGEQQLPQYQPYQAMEQPQAALYYQDNRQQATQAGFNFEQSSQYIPLTGPNQPDYTNYGNLEAKNRESPRDVIYVDTNGETRTEGQPIGQGSSGSSLSNVASMVYENSNLPATILTEVPARDMPEEVLEKLKKDYGVKVVATREHPGANLVINCDESAGQDVLCSRPPQIYPSTGSKQSQYSYPDRAPESAEDNYRGNQQSNERPQIPNEPSNYGQVPAEPQPETYAARDTQPRTLEGPLTGGERGDYSNGYGARNNASPDENHNLDTSLAHQGPNPAVQPEPEQPERIESQPVGEPNGFDESSGGGNNSKNSQQYENRREES